MTRDKRPFSLANPWPRVGWGTLAVILGISLILGFIVLSRYQQNGEPLGVWAAICRGLGRTPDVGPASAPQPPQRTATLVAWTSSTLDQIAAGNAEHGVFGVASDGESPGTAFAARPIEQRAHPPANPGPLADPIYLLSRGGAQYGRGLGRDADDWAAVRVAALARSEARGHRRLKRVMQLDVRRIRPPRCTRWPAVNPGRHDGVPEEPVSGAVPGDDARPPGIIPDRGGSDGLFSKAVLRVAAEQIASMRENVEYFPSYEIITGTYNRGAYYAPDLRSITETGVNHVMRLFLRHFTDIDPSSERAMAVPPPDYRTVLADAAEMVRVICEEEVLDRAARMKVGSSCAGGNR